MIERWFLTMKWFDRTAQEGEVRSKVETSENDPERA